VVAGLLGAAGLFFFFVGGFLTLPLYFLITLFLYEVIFNAPAQAAAKETDPLKESEKQE